MKYFHQKIYILFLTGSEDQYMWTYMKPTTPEKVQTSVNSNTTNEMVPKVKLTGTGKMPVMDMRSQSLLKCQQQESSSLHPSVSGLPPKSPVYAAVNKTKKLSPVKKQPAPLPPAQPRLPQNQPAHLHNYCNVSPLLGDVINKKPELFSQVQPEIVFNCLKKQSTNQKQPQQQKQQKHLYENTEPIFVAHHENKMSNYLPMGPDSLDDLPIRPFEPTNYSENQLEEPLGMFLLICKINFLKEIL